MNEAKLPQKKSAMIVGTIVALITFGLSFWGIQKLLFSEPSAMEAIAASAIEMNKSCPIMADADTRLDNAVSSGNIFQYNYTLVNAEELQIKPDEIIQKIEPIIIRNIKTNPELKIYKDNNITMVYNYVDKNGVFVFKLLVTPEQYL